MEEASLCEQYQRLLNVLFVHDIRVSGGRMLSTGSKWRLFLINLVNRRHVDRIFLESVIHDIRITHVLTDTVVVSKVQLANHFNNLFIELSISILILHSIDVSQCYAF